MDADLGLRGGDLRAAERTYQLMAQATGRAGRADKPGRALLQTWTPEHPVLMALGAGDRDAFVEAEMAEREAASLPPYGRLAAIILSSENAQALEKTAADLAQAIPNAERLEVYGPADAPLALVRGRRRKAAAGAGRPGREPSGLPAGLAGAGQGAGFGAAHGRRGSLFLPLGTARFRWP